MPCGHNFCQGCLGALRQRQGPPDGSGGAGGAARCPLCQEPVPADLRLCKNRALCEVLPLLAAAAAASSPPSPAAVSPMAPGAEEEDAAGEEGAAVLCDVCPAGSREAAARSCLVCLASFCGAHLEPHRRAPAFRAHRLVAPLRRLEQGLCPRHLQPLDGFCRTEQTCVCARCRAHEHRTHDVVPLEREREHKEVRGGARVGPRGGGVPVGAVREGARGGEGGGVWGGEGRGVLSGEGGGVLSGEGRGIWGGEGQGIQGGEGAAHTSPRGT